MFDFLGNLTIWHYLIGGGLSLGGLLALAWPKIRDAVRIEIGQTPPASAPVADSLGSGFAHLRELDALYAAAKVPGDERRKLLLDGVARLYGPSEAKP